MTRKELRTNDRAPFGFPRASAPVRRAVDGRVIVAAIILIVLSVVALSALVTS